MNKVRSWGLKPGEGGMYWSTYKASLRRDGVWNRNMNEEMAEPVYRAVATQWCVRYISPPFLLASTSEVLKPN
jgi:hypothetical protein